MLNFQDEETRLRNLIDKHTPLGPGRNAIMEQLLRHAHAHQDMRARFQGEAALRPQRQSVALAIEVLSEEPDGERLLERAYRADPKRTSIELGYLGADRVRGAIAVRAAIDDGGATQRHLDL